MSEPMPEMVWVRWEDATSLDAEQWTTTDNHEYKPAVMCQVGFLLADLPDGVILTSTWSAECVATRDQIPRGMIIEMGKLAPSMASALKGKKCK